MNIVKFSDAPIGEKLYAVAGEDYQCGNCGDELSNSGWYIKRLNGPERSSTYTLYDSDDNKVRSCFDCLERNMFALADNTRPVVGKNYVVNSGVTGFYYREGDVLRFVKDDGTYTPWFINTTRETNNGNRIAVNLSDINLQGESKMQATTEEKVLPEYIVITRNTEVFAKGGVFKKQGNQYNPVDCDDLMKGFQVEPYSYRQSAPQIELLLKKGVAVEAVQFNPQFVTLAQNQVLKIALDNMAKKPAIKKSVKKSK